MPGWRGGNGGGSLLEALPAPANDCSISINKAELILGSDKALIFAAFGRVLLALPPFVDEGDEVGDAGDLLLLGEPTRPPRALLEPNCE